MGKEDLIRELRKIPGENLEIRVGDSDQIIVAVEIVDGVIWFELMDAPERVHADS